MFENLCLISNNKNLIESSVVCTALLQKLYDSSDVVNPAEGVQ